MAGPSSQNLLRASILDRISEGGRVGAKPRSEVGMGLNELKQAVRRDLQWLLNARRADDARVMERKEASRSVLAFGLPDLTSASAASPSDRARIARLIEATIAAFEPRLSRVKVDFIPPGAEEFERSLRFRINAILRVEPVSEMIAFNAGIESATGRIQVD